MQPSVESRFSDIQSRIDRALRSRGTESLELVLLGASKGQPVERLAEAWRAGLRVFGENRIQEAETKMHALPPAAEWHLIGPLQSNKAARAAEHFDAIHSLDRLKIANLLNRHAASLGKRLPCFVQVNMALEKTKRGFAMPELEVAADELLDLPSLEIVGLMAIPPKESTAEGSRRWFRELRELRDRHSRAFGWLDRQGSLSMGMSHDFEVAIEEGATHIRIGTALFGERQGSLPSAC